MVNKSQAPISNSPSNISTESINIIDRVESAEQVSKPILDRVESAE